MDSLNPKAVWPGWKTVRLIGNGSFGAVYEIERDMLGEKEKAALKLITIPQSSSDIDELYGEGYDSESITGTFQTYLKSIVSEYSLMRKLNGSSNVVNCDDVRYVQHEDGIGWDIFIKMELLTPLTKALGKDVPEAQVVRIGADICKALVLCRKHNIIHRDIKPANIFVSENGDYKLGDFGIAKTVERTSGGTKIGTYEYMAPEVYQDRPYGSQADIYSLGLVLYWLLNERRTPFVKLPPELPTAAEKEQARQRRFRGEPLPAPAHGSEELKRIVLKACAYDSADRYQSAEEMLRDLEALTAAPAQESDETLRISSAPTVPPAMPAAGSVPVQQSRFVQQPVPVQQPRFVQQPVPVQQPRFVQQSVPVQQPGSAQQPNGDETVRPSYGPAAPQYMYEAPAGYGMGAPAPAAPKKSKKGLLFGILGGLFLLAAVLLIVFLPKNGRSDEPAEPDTVRTAPDTDRSAPAGEPAGEKEADLRTGEETAAWGVIGAISGTNWDADFPMHESGDRFASEPLELHSGDEFKVRQGASWDVNFGADGSRDGPNCVVEEPGVYEVVLEIISDTEASITLHKVGDAEDPVPTPAHVTVVDRGSCGAGLSWELTSDDLLTISGRGPMDDDDWSDVTRIPWRNRRENIRTVVIEPGVTSIGVNAFCSCTDLTDVSIPGSVTSIGPRAFIDCSGLQDVYYGGTVAQWKSISFAPGNGLLWIYPTLHYSDGSTGYYPDLSDWSVVGNFEGTDWRTDYNMWKAADNVYLSNAAITLKEGDELKVRWDRSWTVNYGADARQDGPNVEVLVTGVYIVSLTIDEDGCGWIELIRVGDA